ncbi:MAG: Potassium-transporting ATPase potassium-binding subunit [Sodalis sp.]|nr:MAG: Potassium-transporting ATPase potassium-binding subunit [Sodalis sp.]
MHDSFTALGSLIPLWLIQFSGPYSMLINVAVFIAELMIGRTPEIGVPEMKMAAIYIFITPRWHCLERHWR